MILRPYREILFDFLHEERQGIDGRRIGCLLLFAFLLRVPLLLYPEVIHNDGAEYIRQATQILSGNWAGSRVPPFYAMLIALAHTLVQNYELAGIWVSVIFGTLVVLPVFYLGRELFDERVGMISALIASVHPLLSTASGSVLTESVYYFLLATSVLYGWYAFQRGRFVTILAFGLLTSMAYLTRPEGIGLLFVFCVWVLAVRPYGEERRWMKRGGMIFIAILSFLAFSSPYLIQLRIETGRWEISKKTSVSIGSLSGEEETPSIDTIKRKKGMTLSSLVKNPLSVVGRIGVGILDSFYKFQQGYDPVLFVLAILGWIFLFKNKKRYSLKGSFYLLAYLVFLFGFILPFFWVTRRYTSQMIPISLPWAGIGFLGVVDRVKHRFPEKKGVKAIPVILLVLLLGGLLVQGRVIHPREHRVIQKEAGLWMKKHLPRDARVMSAMPQEAFYAELPWDRMPKGAYEEILHSARSDGVRYFVINEKTEEDSPRFLEKMKKEDLVLLMEWKMKNRKIGLFEVVYPAGKG